jgi:hypothetical protein
VTLASLRSVHQDWAWVVILANGMAGLWALGAIRWAQLRRPELWWFTAAAQLSGFVEVILGVAMVAGKEVSDDLRFHMFYGFLILVAVGILYSYRHQLRDRLYLLYGLGGLFIMGLGIRALQLG